MKGAKDYTYLFRSATMQQTWARVSGFSGFREFPRKKTTKHNFYVHMQTEWTYYLPLLPTVSWPVHHAVSSWRACNRLAWRQACTLSDRCMSGWLFRWTWGHPPHALPSERQTGRDWGRGHSRPWTRSGDVRKEPSLQILFSPCQSRGGLHPDWWWGTRLPPVWRWSWRRLSSNSQSTFWGQAWSNFRPENLRSLVTFFAWSRSVICRKRKTKSANHSRLPDQSQRRKKTAKLQTALTNKPNDSKNST